MNPVTYTGRGGTGPSPLIYEQINVPLIQADPQEGYGLFEDFECFGGSVTTNVGTYMARSGAWKSYEDTSTSITPAARVNGEIDIATDTTDNNEVWLQSGYSQAAPFKIASTGGKKLIFEARIKIDNVTNSKAGFFVGLAEEGLAAANTIADAGTIASKDLIGFFRPEGDGDGIDFVYRLAGQAMQTVIEDIPSALSTYTTLGFVFDPNEDDSHKITVVVDGVAQNTFVTQTNIEAATFPDGEELAPIIGLKNATTTAVVLTADWLYAFQKR